MVLGALGDAQSRIVTRFSSEVGAGKGWPRSSLCFYVPKWGSVATANWEPPAACPSGKGCLGGRRWGSRERVAGFVTTPSLSPQPGGPKGVICPFPRKNRSKKFTSRGTSGAEPRGGSLTPRPREHGTARKERNLPSPCEIQALCPPTCVLIQSVSSKMILFPQPAQSFPKTSHRVPVRGSQVERPRPSSSFRVAASTSETKLCELLPRLKFLSNEDVSKPHCLLFEV